jgi:hypothetical protein
LVQVEDPVEVHGTVPPITGQIQAVQFSDGEIIRQPLQIISLEVECLQIGKIPQKLVSDAFDPDVDHLQNPNFVFQNWRSDLTDVTAENGDIFYVGKPLQQQIEIKIGLFDVSQLQHSDIWGKFVSECWQPFVTCQVVRLLYDAVVSSGMPLDSLRANQFQNQNPENRPHVVLFRGHFFSVTHRALSHTENWKVAPETLFHRPRGYREW